MVSQVLRKQLIFKPSTTAELKLAVLVYKLATLVILLIVLVARQPLAGPSIYNMNYLLAEPHPFLTKSLTKEITSQGSRKLLSDGTGESDQDEFEMSNSGLRSEVKDPFESLNRLTFSFNEIVRQYLLGPVVKWYNVALPEVAREGIKNALNNLSSPVVLANDVLQGEFRRGLNTVSRLVINTTAGVGGFIDVAENLGIEGHKEDFGQTLAVWGMGDGFYLVLPLLGPSNPRDALGEIFIDSYFDPFGYYLDEQDLSELKYALTGVKGIVTYAEVIDHLESLKETSVDFYGTIRSLHQQRRKMAILNQS